MSSLQDAVSCMDGYDPDALHVDRAREVIRGLVRPIRGTQRLFIREALGRVLACEVVSPIDVPGHDNAAMDGYALRGCSLSAHGETRLRIAGTALAGRPFEGRVGEGECVRIMTGAIMPSGLNTVVPQELVTVADDWVTFPANMLKPGDNRRFQGEDLMRGQPALQKGELLTPAALGLVASLGIKTVPVLRRLKVAYFSTGDEILSLGEPPREGAVYDSNRYTVFGLLTRLGCEVIDLGVVRDQPEALEAAFILAAQQADAVITSGGVSVGEADYTRAMMKKLGDVTFWKIAMRPGRPMAVGRISKSILFGLPGNPVAVMVTFLAFVRPALLRMMGCKAAAAPLLQAHSLEAIRKKPGRTEYQRGIVSTAANGTLQVKTTGNQGSGVLSSMVQANGLIVLHHTQGSIAVGETVDVMMFNGAV